MIPKRPRLPLLLLAVAILGFRGSPRAFEALGNPRLAAGDLDGDGRDEVLVAGRLGPFVPLTDPESARAAGVRAYVSDGTMLRPVASCEDLHTADDVAAADLDGDGRDEVLVVGSGRLAVLSLSGDRLVLRHTVPLPWTWTHRVAAADLDADGRDEVLVAAYEVAPDGGVGTTALALGEWTGADLTILQEVRVHGHVGDLACILPIGEPPLVVAACGAGDEAGDGIAFSFQGRRLVETWRAPLGQGRARVRALSSLPGSDRLAAVAVDATVSYLRCRPGGPIHIQTDRLAAPAAGLLFPSKAGPRLVLAGSPRGSARGPVLTPVPLAP